MDLSVVVISRNEEAAIGACLESLLEHTKGLKTEIILVDSASTDRTLEIAGRYPVTIVRIEECQELSPSAGRYLGTLQATGKYIFFLDGDMILHEVWIGSALSHFEDSSVAAVAGMLYRVYPGEELNQTHRIRYVLGKVRYLAGSGIYRRDVLEEVGTFNPFVKGEEERELGYRITRAGFSILRLDIPMVYHMEKARTKSELDEKARYFTGVGQIFRHYRLQQISRDLLVAHRSIFSLHLFGLCVVVLLLLFAARGLLPPALIVLGAGVFLGLLLVFFKGGKKVYLFLRSRFLISANIITGLGKGIPNPRAFKAVTSVRPTLAARDTQDKYPRDHREK